MRLPIIALLLTLLLTAAPQKQASPFCSDCEATRKSFRQWCDYIADNKRDVATIFTAGYCVRDLVAGHKLFGDQRYLDVAVAYADKLAFSQTENASVPFSV